MFSIIISPEKGGGGGGVHILVHMSENADSDPCNHQVDTGQGSVEAEKAAPMSPLSHTSSLNDAT